MCEKCSLCGDRVSEVIKSATLVNVHNVLLYCTLCCKLDFTLKNHSALIKVLPEVPTGSRA